MWTVVYVSQNKDKIDRILSLLEDNDILTMFKAPDEEDFDTESAFEILVPRAELETAQDIILDFEI